MAEGGDKQDVSYIATDTMVFDSSLSTEWISLHFGTTLTNRQKRRFGGFRVGYKAGFEFGGWWGTYMQKRFFTQDDLSEDAYAELKKYDQIASVGYTMAQVIEKAQKCVDGFPLHVDDGTNRNQNAMYVDDDSEHQEMPATWYTKDFENNSNLKHKEIRMSYWYGYEIGSDIGIFHGIRLVRDRHAGLDPTREDEEMLKAFEMYDPDVVQEVVEDSE